MPRMRVHARVNLVKRLAFTSLLCGSAACSLFTDTETKQCRQASDCQALFGSTAPYLCEADFCTRPTCDTDAQCRGHGESFKTSICGGDKRCVVAECTSNNACGVGGVCDLMTNRCTARECQVLADCQVTNPSPTVQCVGGRCVDEVWGCIGQADNRTPEPGLATVKIPFADGVKRTPVESAMVRACVLPAFDTTGATTCTGINGAVGSFERGMATVTGLTAGSVPRIVIVPESTDMLLPVDFYSQKAVLGVTTTPIVTTVNSGVVRSLVSSFTDPTNPARFITVPEKSAGATVTVFNCLDKPAEKVLLSLRTEDLLSDTDNDPATYEVTLISYFGENLLPNPDQKETGTTGLATIINMRAGSVLTLSAVVNGTPLQGAPRTLPMTTLQVMAYKERLTAIHLYPRVYSITGR